MFSLEGKTALITGGVAGIGAAVARDFITAGARVVLADVNPDGAVIAEDMGAGFVQMDVSDERQVKDGLERAAGLAGDLDVLVLNAGIGPDLPPLTESDGEIERKVLDINLRGVLYGLMHGPGHMRDGGSIIATASTGGDGTTTVGMSTYAASKAGVVYLCRTAAVELGPRRIRVNAVSPAGIAGTGMSNAAPFIEHTTALGRMGTLDEVVPAYRFLASDEAAFVTGTTLRVDGGMTAGFPLPFLDLIPWDQE